MVDYKGLGLFLSVVTIMFFITVSLDTISQVYKYKDANGNWVYSDKQPISDLSYEKTQYKTIDNKTIENKKNHPIIYRTVGNDDDTKMYLIMGKNPLFCPVEVSFTSPIDNQEIHKVIPARATKVLLESQINMTKVTYNWLFGDPKIKINNKAYQTPFLTKAGHEITQAFNGRFSHQGEYSRYAVDIAMPVGTNIHAVREGTVVWVKDNFHMSGRTQYFLDKANVIKVLHSDGTFALYAHILMDTASVKVGDNVIEGQLLARSGSSGFSTGPHLHFMIFRNVGFKVKSIPFKFTDQQGHAITPRAGMNLISSH